MERRGPTGGVSGGGVSSRVGSTRGVSLGWGICEGKGGPRLDEAAGVLKKVYAEDEVVVGHGDDACIDGDGVGGR